MSDEAAVKALVNVIARRLRSGHIVRADDCGPVAAVLGDWILISLRADPDAARTVAVALLQAPRS